MSFFSAAIQALVEPSRTLGRPSLPRRLLDVIVPAKVAGRRAWAADGRAAIEVPGVHLPGSEELADQLQEALEQHPGVLWAAVNAPLDRVIVALTVDRAPLEELVDLVRSVENRFRGAPELAAHEGGPLIDSLPVERAAVELVADVAGIAAAVLVRLLKVAPIAAEVAAGVSVVDSTPRLRGYVERALGQPRADTALALANAAVQALSQGFAGLAVDSALRGLILREAATGAAAWRAAQGKYLMTKETAGAFPVGSGQPLRAGRGPIEKWGDSAGALGLSVFGVGLSVTGSPWQASGLAVSTLPKPGRVGREAFAAQLGTMLSRRGAVILDPEALRRLDRVDTILIDGDVLATGRYVMVSSVPLPGADREQVAQMLHALFRPDEPHAIQRDRTWSLGPVDTLLIAGRRGVRERRRLEAEGATVLGLARGSRLMALAGATAEPHEYLDALTSACRRCGCRVVVAGDPGAHPLNGAAEELRSEGGMLSGSVRALRETGCRLMLISSNRQALAEADVAVGIETRTGQPGWGSHILLGRDLGLAPVLIEACGRAAAVTRDSVKLAQAGTVIGMVAAGMGSPRAGVSRSMLAVNAASAVAFVLAVRAAFRLGGRVLIPGVSSVPWHAMPPDAVLRRLASSPEGLTVEQVRRRQAQPGLPEPAPASFLGAVVEELANPLTPVLGAGAALSAAIGAVVDGLLIAGVALLSGVIGGIERLRTDRALDALWTESAVIARVRRAGGDSKVPAHRLVPGDIVYLGPGDVVPADCRVIETTGLEADESSLTGEAFPVSKGVAGVIADVPAERSSMLYEGTTVASGRAVAAVVATGAATEAGRSAAAGREGVTVSGVERRLTAITNVTVPVTLASAVAVVAAGLARGKSIRNTAGAGLSLAVAAVPEGLPFLVSAAQLAAARRLSVHGVLVRNPRTIEALGRVDVLCFDKTGTLTEGRIRLEAVFTVDQALVPVDRLGWECRRVLAAALRATPEQRSGGKLEHFTDRAVTSGAKEAGVTRGVGDAGWNRHTVLPFEPARAYHAAVGSAAGQTLLSIKGAPESVIPRCSAVRQHGGDVPLDGREARRLGHRVDRLARQGYRILAVAERRATEAPELHKSALNGDDVQELTLLGFLALTDPVRAAAAPSITTLRSAGVQIIMITGDHPGTARAVAERLGLLNGGRVVTGSEMDALDDESLEKVLPSVAVVARGTPAHKVRVVQAFQRLHRTVAMTGDGANDAPAIRLADVGIALGRRGTPAARAAADLVVTDDRLETIITALVEGRSMWASVREALGILVGGNLGEIAFTVLGAALSGLSPLGARQLLLVNLLTDLAPALAVALRPPQATSAQALLAEGPEASLGRALVRDVGARALITAVGAGGAWLTATALGLGAAAPTIALAGLIGTQLGQTLISGTPTRGVILSGAGSAVLLAAVIQNPVLSAFFGSTPLGLPGWTVVVTVAAAAAGLSLLLPRISSAFAGAADAAGEVPADPPQPI